MPLDIFEMIRNGDAVGMKWALAGGAEAGGGRNEGGGPSLMQAAAANAHEMGDALLETGTGFAHRNVHERGAADLAKSGGFADLAARITAPGG